MQNHKQEQQQTLQQAATRPAGVMDRARRPVNLSDAATRLLASTGRKGYSGPLWSGQQGPLSRPFDETDARNNDEETFARQWEAINALWEAHAEVEPAKAQACIVCGEYHPYQVVPLWAEMTSTAVAVRERHAQRNGPIRES